MWARRPTASHPALLRRTTSTPGPSSPTPSPADQPGLRHPPDGLARARRDREVPLPRPSDSRQVTDGIRLLEELQAFAPEDETPSGGAPTSGTRSRHTAGPSRRSDRPPPRADGHRGAARRAARGARHRRRPVDPGSAGATPGQAELADAAHKRFADETSDFLSLAQPLGLPQGAAASPQLQRLPPDVQGGVPPLPAGARVAGPPPRSSRPPSRPASTSAGQRAPVTGVDTDAIHQSLLAGLLSHVGVRDEQRPQYLGARGARFGISPGSALFRKQPQFVMAESSSRRHGSGPGSTPESTRRGPSSSVSHLVKRQYSEPRWSEVGGRPSPPSGDALRRAAHRRPRRGPRPDRPRAAVTCSSGTRSSRATGPPSTRSSARTPASSSHRRTRAEPGGATSSSTTPCWSPSTTSDPRARSCRSTLRPWWKKARRQTPTCSASPRTSSSGQRRGTRHGGVPDDVAPGGPRPRCHVPVRPRLRLRRRHRPHPRRPAQPGDRRRLRLAGPRLARGARHGAHPLAAQGAPPPPRAAPDHARAVLPELDPATGPWPALLARGAAPPGRRGGRAGRRRLEPRPEPPAGDVQRRLAHRRAGRHGQGPRGRPRSRHAAAAPAGPRRAPASNAPA